jgi:hypothetical protein
MLANSSIKGNQERTVWTAFFLPKATPTAIVDRLARATSDALDPLCQNSMAPIIGPGEPALFGIASAKRKEPRHLGWSEALRGNGQRVEVWVLPPDDPRPSLRSWLSRLGNRWRECRFGA